jgi:hypothetical protein
MKLFRKRRILKGELRNVDVNLISLLFDEFKPANMRGAVIKSADGKGHYKPVAVSGKFKSETVGDQGLLYVTVMEPDTVDSQGDSYSAAEIQKAATNFLKKGVVGKNDVNHNNQPAPEFVIAESYILKTADKEHFPDTKVGSWVAVLQCTDLNSELWQKVKKGQFNGVSIAGWAEDSGDNNAEVVAELKQQMAEIRKALGDNPGPESEKVLAKLQTRINELEKADENAATKELIKAFTSEIKELSMSISRAIRKSLNGEPDGGVEKDREVVIDGKKIVIKAAKREIYKGIAQVDGGSPMNILTPTTTSLFIDEVVGSVDDDTLNDITVVPLLKDEKIDAGIVQDIILNNSLDPAPVLAQDVASADISCATGILTGEFSLGRDVVEFYKDKHGEDAFGAYVENHIAKKVSKAIKKLLFQGDRNSATATIKALNGVIKLASSANKVVNIDSGDYPAFADRFEQALLSFSEDVLAEQANFVFYVSNKDLVRLRAELAQRETGAGDRFLLEGGNVFFSGIPVKPRFMPDGYIIAGLPKFIIIGYRTDAELKVEHHGKDWKYHWYVRVRPGITYVDGFAKVFQAVAAGGGAR